MLESLPSVVLECPVCDTPGRVPARAKQLACRTCEVTTFFCACVHCGASAGVAGHRGAPPARWRCPACHRTVTVPLVGQIKLRRADEMLASLGLSGSSPAAGAPALRPITGFVVVGTTHSPLMLGSRSSVTVGAAELLIDGSDFPARFAARYEAIDVLEVSGRGADRVREARGGRVSRVGAFEPEDTVLRVTSGETRIVVKHTALTRGELRVLLAPAMSRWTQARTVPA